MLSLEAATSPRRSSRNLVNSNPKTRLPPSSNPLIHPPPPPPPVDRKGKGKSRSHVESTVELSVAGRNRPVKRGSKGIDKERLIVESMRFNVEQGSAQSARLNQQESNSKLPRLLSHLSLSPSFPEPYASTSSFVFPSIESSLLSLQLPPLPTSKRPPLSPTSAQTKRCKKRKLLHSFIRSPLLLSPPSPSSTTRPNNSTLSPPPPKWWASISNCSGESKPSRFSPSEEAWCEPSSSRAGVGGGTDWKTLTENFRRSGGGGEFSVTTTRQKQTLLSRPLIPRSVSAPVVSLDQRIELREEEEEDVVPISGPALKKLLLTSLRNKWTSEGGPTSAGEAALRFKKWVLWNSWRLSTSLPPLPTQIDQSPSSTSTLSATTKTSDQIHFLDSITSEEDLPSFTSSGDDESVDLVPSSYFTTITTDESGQVYDYMGDSGGGECRFTQTGQIVFIKPQPQQPSSSSLPTPPEGPREKGRKERPGLRRSETVPPSSGGQRSIVCDA